MVNDDRPTPVRCPVIHDPDLGLADPADFDPLLDRLADPGAVREAEEFPRGTLRPDGRLDLCKQGLGPRLVERVAQRAVASGHARHLLLGTNALGADGTRAVARVLTPGHRVDTLYLGCNRIDAAAVAPLADRIAGDGSLRALWLKRNPLGDDGVLRLCAALARNASLRTLDLVNVGLTTRGLVGLADALTRRTARLQRVFLGGNGFGPDAVPALVALLDAGVAELYVAVNALGDRGAVTLAEAAAGRRVALGLGSNGITPDGVAELAGRMSRWTRLDLARAPSERALGATGNVVGDRGAEALAEAVPGATLRRLDLRATGITPVGARSLLAAIDGHPTLEYLGLGGGIPRPMRRAALAATGRPRTPAHPDITAIASVYR